MAEKYRERLRIAKYYHNDGLTQQEIADKLNVSRPTVSNALKKAKEEGIIQVRVVDIKNKGGLVNLEQELKDAYGLKEVRLVDCNSDKYEDLVNCIGGTAALYLEDIIKDNLKIGISWGTTLKSMVDNLSGNKKINNLELVTLVGGSGNLKPEVHSNILSDKILSKFNGRGYFLYAPAVVDNQDVWQALMKNDETQKLLEKAKNVDIALVGIGAPIGSSNLVETGYFEKEQIKEMQNLGIAGDICSRFFDEDGMICDLEINKRTIGITLDDLKNINEVIGVAGGEEKVSSIVGALKGGFLDVLITDAKTAKLVLEKK